MDVTFAFITETWLPPGEEYHKLSEDLLLGSAISILSRSRDPVQGLYHGGVAILACSTKTTLKEYKVDNPDKYEVLTAAATVRGLSRKVFLISAYIPPGYTVARGRGCLEYISDIILNIKYKHEDPLICLGGDFNQWRIEDHMLDYPDMQEIKTPPTRNDRRIDRIFCNWHERVHESGVLPPLETEDPGVERRRSDHLIQYAKASLPKKAPPKKISYSYRPFSKKKAASFKLELQHQDWREVMSAETTNDKEQCFQAIIDDLMERNFPMKHVTRKEGDLPWLDDKAVKMIKRKKMIYKEESRSPRWIAAREELDGHLEDRRIAYLDRQKTNLTSADASKQFFKNVKNYRTAERVRAFDVTELYPEKNEREVSETVADYFNEISREFRPLDPADVPTTYERSLGRLTCAEVAKRLRSQKKPSSMVLGDLFPSTINDLADILSVPLADIYNSILRDYVWPVAWKREYVTVIPKKNIPAGLSDLRNISCTRFFSKVFEAFVLERLCEEVELKSNQYGGVKGCSTGHVLVEVVQRLCQNLEDYRSGTVLTALDYSKAFNRMSFQHCLAVFKKKGSSTPILRLLATFLTNRTMSVRVGKHWSAPRLVNGGCPQGSILGVMLFNMTTDDLEDNFVRQERQRLGLTTPLDQAQEPLTPSLGAPNFVTSSPVGAEQQFFEADLSDVGPGFFDHEGTPVSFRPGTVNPPPGIEADDQIPVPIETPTGTQVLVEEPVEFFKYVDDSISVEKLNFGLIAITLDENGRPVKVRRATGSQNGFRSVTKNARRKLMAVNEHKTKIVCIADNMNYTARVFIEDSAGVRIDCEDSIRVLGFDLTNKPTMHAQVASISKRMRQRYWVLRHLKKLGMCTDDLVLVYTSMIVPIADYCDYVYHSLLTDEQDLALETVQVGALRVIYGSGLSGRRMRQMSGVKTLRDRRIEHADRFAEKALANDRFRHWFPLKESRTSQRTGDKYLESYARCDRLRMSPLFYMRRRLNGKNGKEYGERYRIYRET